MMAINTANSNFVNISNLPQTQEAVNTDLVILQTENGTQTITFENLNVVKTDASGNATIIGSVTGNDGYFEVLSASTGINSTAYACNNTAGFNAVNSFYNRFTVVGGIVTSATYVNYKDNDYLNITDIFIPAVTAWQDTQYAKVVEKYGSVEFNSGESIQSGAINDLFGTNNPLSNSVVIYPYHFTLTSTGPLSAAPYIANIAKPGVSNQNLTFDIGIGYPLPGISPAITIYWRMVYFR